MVQLGQSTIGRAGKIKAGEEIISRTLENPTAGRWLAGAYYHITDARFTAWDRYSTKLVPRAAQALAGGVEKLSPYGWLVYEAEAGHALAACTDVYSTHD